MNKIRRKELATVIRELGKITCKEDLSSCINDLEMLKNEEESYHDNMPENLQYSFRADQSQDAIDNMDEALSILNDIYGDDSEEDFSDQISDAISKIEDASF